MYICVCLYSTSLCALVRKHANTLILQLNTACKWVPAVCSQWGGYHEAAPAQMRSHRRPPGSYWGEQRNTELVTLAQATPSHPSMPSMQQQEFIIYPPMIQWHVHLCTCIRPYTYVCTYTYVYVHICTYVSVGQLIVAHMRLTTHTHTCTKSLVKACEDT